MYLRDYRESDADEIIKWIHSEREFRLWSFKRYNDYPVKPQEINENYKKCIEEGYFYPKVLVDGDKIVGHIILRNPDGNEDIVRLGFVIVDSEIRGKGYGKILVREAIKYAQNELKAKEINLGVFSANESAYKCYESVGFKVKRIDKNVLKYNDEEWDCIEMVLQND